MRILALILAGGLFVGCAPTLVSNAAASAAPSVQACLASAANADERRACVGQVNLACQDEGDGGVTTAGMVMCADRERAQWQAVGEAAATALAAHESPTQAAAQRRAAGAHAAWLQARCAYDTSYYEGGSLSRYAAAACVMGETANYALILHERVINAAEQ